MMIKKGLFFSLLLVAIHPVVGGETTTTTTTSATNHNLRARELTDTDNPSGGATTSTCFSAEATVEVRDKGIVSMKDLQIGDEVLVSKSTAGGALKGRDNSDNYYQRVYAFLHRKEETLTEPAEFFQLETTATTKRQLEITKDHLLYVEGKVYPVPAGSIVAGDVLLQTGNKPATVTNITPITRSDGVYAPLTPSGVLVVDGMKVSTYVKLDGLERHWFMDGVLDMAFLQHIAISPYRFVCRWVSPATANVLNDKGLPPFISFMRDFGSWIVQQSLPVQVFVIFWYGLFATFVYILECVLDSGWLGLFLIIAVMSFVLHKNKQMIFIKKV